MAARATPEPKACVACGRAIEWRKKWERDWGDVRYCSKRCRSQRVHPAAESIEAAILGLLDERRSGATICPSEAARAVAGSDDDWRALMEPTRSVARQLAADGQIDITQRGQIVDPSTAKGAIRLRRRGPQQ